LLICQLLDSSGRIQLGPMLHLLALDRLGAAPGSRVLLIDDPDAAARLLAGDIAPAEALVVSIVDEAPSRAA
jgi:microcompartment protein CcmK/EutM